MFVCEIHHTLIFSKFDSFSCVSHKTIFNNKYFKNFHLILTWEVMSFVNVANANCLISGLLYLVVVACEFMIFMGIC